MHNGPHEARGTEDPEVQPTLSWVVPFSEKAHLTVQAPPSDLAELPQTVVNGAEPRHSYCDLLLCRSSYSREGKGVIVCGAGRRQLSNLTR